MSTWQSIATAPQDGTRVLLRVPFHQFENPVVQHVTDAGYWTHAGPSDPGYWRKLGWDRLLEPTHWQPMPPSELEAMPPRLIVCAALRHPFLTDLIIGPRHYDLFMHRQIDEWSHDDNDKLPWPKAIQGFIDQRGVFLTRTEAWKVAASAGQIRRRVGGDTADGGTLFSENLY